MKRINIYLLLLLSGVLSSTLSSCGTENISWIYYVECIYENATSHSLELTGYCNKFGPEYAETTWNIAPKMALTIEKIIGDSGVQLAPIDCDSVRLLFDGHRELWYRWGDLQPGNILKFGVEKKKKHNRVTYTHVITEDYYDRATEIDL